MASNVPETPTDLPPGKDHYRVYGLDSNICYGTGHHLRNIKSQVKDQFLVSSMRYGTGQHPGNNKVGSRINLLLFVIAVDHRRIPFSVVQFHEARHFERRLTIKHLKRFYAPHTHLNIWRPRRSKLFHRVPPNAAERGARSKCQHPPPFVVYAQHVVLQSGSPPPLPPRASS